MFALCSMKLCSVQIKKITTKKFEIALKFRNMYLKS
jgi:hypothetical protein